MKARNELQFSLSINGIPVKVGKALQEAIADKITDVGENLKLFEVLATSPCMEVRKSIARKDTQSKQIIETLIDDECASVVNALTGNRDALKLMSEDQVLHIISQGNSEIVNNLSCGLDKLAECDTCRIAERLSTYPDPMVREQLTWKWCHGTTPKNIIKKLTQDSDPDVAATAQDTLQEQ